jgi:hypothetical protein
LHRSDLLPPLSGKGRRGENNRQCSQNHAHPFN